MSTVQPVVVELGCAGHFVASDSCLWHRHTQVGEYRISSVGDYRPFRGKRETIGAGKKDFFETMVFKTGDRPAKHNEGCGCHEVLSFMEIDGERYATAGEAQAGHEHYVAKYKGAAKSTVQKPEGGALSAYQEMTLQAAQLWAERDKLKASNEALLKALERLVDRDFTYFDGFVIGGQISSVDVSTARAAIKQASA